MMNDWLYEEQPGRFVVDSDGRADLQVRMIIEAGKECDKLVAHYKRQIEIAEKRRHEYIADKTALLREYFDTVPRHETKTMLKYALPSGTLVLKHPGVEYERNETALAEWMLKNGYEGMVKTVYEPSWGELKPLTSIIGEDVIIKETGEIVPGVTAVARGDEFRVEV